MTRRSGITCTINEISFEYILHANELPVQLYIEERLYYFILLNNFIYDINAFSIDKNLSEFGESFTNFLQKAQYRNRRFEY